MAVRFWMVLCLAVISVAAEFKDMTNGEFSKTLASGNPMFVKFYAPWCGHCKRLAPTWQELFIEFSNSSVMIAKVDCTQETSLCSEQQVKGYPTLKLFVGTHVIPYTGQRDLASLKDFVLQHTESDEGDESGLVELDDTNFDPFLKKKGIQFIKFYAPWCGHCQKLAPTWDELSAFYKSNPSVHIGKLDCTKYGDACTKYGINGYPTLLLFEGAIATERYKGERSLNALIQFVRSQIESDEEGTNEEGTNKESPTKGHPLKALELAADTFDNTINEGVAFVKFYAPWCGHCQHLAPTWDQLAEVSHSKSRTTIAKVDCTTHVTLCQRFQISGYPTLLIFVEGERKAEYNKARDLDSLLNFVKEYEE